VSDKNSKEERRKKTPYLRRKIPVLEGDDTGGVNFL
jgi:hypothetical protein